MTQDQDGVSSSSGGNETYTIAYTETIPDRDSITFSSSTYTTSTDSTDVVSSECISSELLAALDQMVEKEETFGYKPVSRHMSTSDGPKMQALEYFSSHYIFQLFSYLMSHLLAHTPENPIPFLISLVDRSLQYRDEGGDPPLLFEDRHINSVYTALDPTDEGVITYDQYLTGMMTLGLTHFNIMPIESMSDIGIVSKGVFLSEAKHALLDQLDRLLGKSQPRRSSEENLLENDSDNLSYELSEILGSNGSDTQLLEEHVAINLSEYDNTV